MRWLIFVFSLFSAAICFASDDSVSFATYYPAPYGVYNEFNTYSNTNLAIRGGNVGIGTDSPGKKLDVSGDIRASGNIFASNDICTDKGGTNKCLSSNDNTSNVFVVTGTCGSFVSSGLASFHEICQTKKPGSTCFYVDWLGDYAAGIGNFCNYSIAYGLSGTSVDDKCLVMCTFF